ncbi:MAG: Kelch repeat-containing protein [Gemmatimonadales bacterium]
MPVPITNNAVAAVTTPSGPAVFSFLGLDATKLSGGIVSSAFRWNVGDSNWTEIESVAGPGRLAATAQVVEGKIYLFGGYTVAQDGTEKSTPHVDIYDPETDSWTSGTHIPIPTDDAVSGVWRDSLIYLVSGWHDRDNIDNVQIYDPATDSWSQATPIPGPPVFGHAGSIAGNTIVYIDGVRTNPERPRFSMAGSSWRGEIDPSDPTKITWNRLADHPGPPLYRAAAGAVENSVVFAGGTDNPYNYNGVGYNGVPSEPRRNVFAYDVELGRWLTLDSLSLATMDHRGIAVAGGTMTIVGGMTAGQTVTRHVATRGASVGGLEVPTEDP